MSKQENNNIIPEIVENSNDRIYELLKKFKKLLKVTV